jgi:hypothetical protein
MLSMNEGALTREYFILMHSHLSKTRKENFSLEDFFEGAYQALQLIPTPSIICIAWPQLPAAASWLSDI